MIVLMSFKNFPWKKLLPFKRPSTIDRYEVRVVTAVEELAALEGLPLEIRYVLAVKPSRFEVFRLLLERGYGIGVRSVEKTPEEVLRAVDRVSRITQRNTIVPWLEDLLREGTLPQFLSGELEQAEKDGIQLYQEVNVIMAQRTSFKKIVIVDLANKGIGEYEQGLMHEINADLYPMAIESIVHRVQFDNAHTRTEVAQGILKALIIIGPIAHALEHVVSGLGKVFAASADDILSEVAELFALRGSGFTWRQLLKRTRILIPIFIVATWAVFQVEPLIQSGRPGLAGLVFGFSAVSLSLTTAIQSIFLYREAYRRLAREGKLQLKPGQTLTGLALRQDFTNPARLGLFMGALAAPVMAGIVFVFLPVLAKNGWALALLGSVESVVAGVMVMLASRIEQAIFRERIRRAMKEIVQPSVPEHPSR